jgi:hypothetical protein
MGLRVSFTKGPSRFRNIDAAVAINHVDLTVTPAPYLAYLKRFPIVINGGLVDVSKSKYCSGILSSNDDHDGPVIIKSNLNSGGYSEHELSQRGWRGTRSRYLRLFRRLRSGSTRESFYPDNAYPIFSHPSLVPAELWSNPNLIAQRFEPELDSRGLYRLRCWYLFGDRGFHVMIVAKEPIVRDNVVDRWVTNDETPPELDALRNEMRVDYGRFDYVIVNGKPVVFDINRTPWSSAAAIAQYVSQWRDLAQGIEAFLR